MTVVVGGSAAAPPGTDEALVTFLCSYEATAGSVEVPLVGRADDVCGVTAY